MSNNTKYGYYVFWVEKFDEYTNTDVKFCSDRKELLEFVNQEKFLDNEDDPYEKTIYDIIKVIKGQEVQLIEKEVKIVKKIEIEG